jgi:hypothetical protein
LLGKQIYPLSNYIKPISIDRQAKWAYMKKVGAPAHLETEIADFEDLIRRYNNPI